MALANVLHLDAVEFRWTPESAVGRRREAFDLYYGGAVGNLSDAFRVLPPNANGCPGLAVHRSDEHVVTCCAHFIMTTF